MDTIATSETTYDPSGNPVRFIASYVPVNSPAGEAILATGEHRTESGGFVTVRKGFQA